MLYGSESEDGDSEADSHAKNIPKSRGKGQGRNARSIPGGMVREDRAAQNELRLRMDNEDPVDLLHAGATTITCRSSIPRFDHLLIFFSIKSAEETTTWAGSISFHD